MKLIGSTHNFLKNSKIVYNPRIVVKSRKIFLKSENMFCHVLLVRQQSASVGRFPAIFRIQNGKEKRLEREVRCSAINEEENLGTMKYSAFGVEH